MISATAHKVGDRVVYVGPSDNGDDVVTGSEGVICFVDVADITMTYRVRFQPDSFSIWVANRNLVAAPKVTPEDTEHCGWRDRALKSEKELAELKKALHTLSEG